MAYIGIVKKADGSTTRAYYHHDQMRWAHFYEKFPWSYWQEVETLEWLTDITHFEEEKDE